MKMTANGTCQVCADQSGPLWDFPESLQMAKDAVAREITVPAANTLNVVLVSGVAAGALVAAFYVYRKLRGA
jgi:hypothetical protein